MFCSRCVVTLGVSLLANRGLGSAGKQPLSPKQRKPHTPCVLLSLKPFVILLAWRVVQCYPYSHWDNGTLTFKENKRERDVCYLTRRSYPEKTRLIESHNNKYCLCSKPATFLYLLPLNWHQSHKTFSIERKFMIFLFKDGHTWTFKFIHVIPVLAVCDIVFKHPVTHYIF